MRQAAPLCRQRAQTDFQAAAAYRAARSIHRILRWDPEAQRKYADHHGKNGTPEHLARLMSNLGQHD
jgi:hypothetical protein